MDSDLVPRLIFKKELSFYSEKMRLGQGCVYSELIQISKIKLFVKLVNSRKLLTILAKSSILDV